MSSNADTLQRVRDFIVQDFLFGRDDGFAVVRVDDDGPGVPPEHARRVFDRFFTFRPGVGGGSRRGGHSGLGLAIVKTIVEGYGGEVGVGQSASGGASFTVRLPAA